MVGEGEYIRNGVSSFEQAPPLAMSPKPTERAPEQQLGRYAIYDKIASGGMATVHLARFAGPLGFSRVVAAKRLHPHLLGDEAFKRMFLDEARLAARIRHPNV